MTVREIAKVIFNEVAEIDFNSISLSLNKKVVNGTCHESWLVTASNDESYAMMVMCHITPDDILLDIYDVDNCKTLELGTYTHSDFITIINEIKRAKEIIQERAVRNSKEEG